LNVKTASASGLLILKAAERYFALSFGFGRNFLDPSKIERRFGLKVALNRIDAQQIRSLDTKTFEDMVVSKTTQTSKNAELSNFGVDAVRDLLRAVTGKPSDESLGRTITGSDALVLTTKRPVTDPRTATRPRSSTPSQAAARSRWRRSASAWRPTRATST